MRETPRAQQAWADYLALGPDRSLERLAAHYRTRTGAVPTVQLSRLKAWSQQHGWQARLAAIAEEQVRLAEEREAAHRRTILSTGYALVHERVNKLKSLAAQLVADLGLDSDRPRFWVSEPKGIGAGDNFREVDVARFNASEIQQLRGVLDDLAREVGGRVHKSELTGRNGGPIEAREARTVLYLPHKQPLNDDVAS